MASKPDKVICKRLVETGSLVKGAKTCKTRQAWERDGEAARRHVREMQDAALVNSNAPQ